MPKLPIAHSRYIVGHLYLLLAPGSSCQYKIIIEIWLPLVGVCDLIDAKSTKTLSKSDRSIN